MVKYESPIIELKTPEFTTVYPPKPDLTRRSSRRLAGLFPPVIMIRMLPEIVSRALIRILPMLTRSGFPLAPFTSRG